MRWPTAALGDLCQINIGRTPSRSVSAFWEGGAHPWLSISDMGRSREIRATKEGITEAAIHACNMRLVNPGTVLFSFKLSIGKVGIASIPLFTNEAIASLPILDSRILCEDFLVHALEKVSKKLVGDRAAMGMTLNKASLAEIQIPLPPLEEQLRIAAILDKACSTKMLAMAASGHFESLSLAIFDELFGARAWPTVSLEDVTTRITNGYVGPTRDIYVNEGIPYLLAKHVKRGRLSYCGGPKVSPAFNEKQRKSKLLEGDVLLVQSGHIGSSCVVPREHDGHNCHAMIVISPIKDLLLGQYLSLLFQTQKIQRVFLGIQTGITLPHLNCKDVRKIQIPLPPIESQILLGERLSMLSSRSSLAARQIALASLLECSLADQFLGST